MEWRSAPALGQVAARVVTATCVALSPDGSLVAVGDVDGEFIVREVPSGGERWKVRVHARGAARRIDGRVFSSDGSLLVSTGYDARTVELWQVLTGRQVAVLDIRDSRSAAFHPIEQTLVVGAQATVHVVDAERREVARTLPNAHQGEAVYGVAFSPDGQVLATVSDQGSLKLWDWPALSLRASVSMSKSLEPMAPVSLALTRRGTRAAANGIVGQVHVVDAAKEREERTFANTVEAPGHAPRAEMRRSLAFSEDGDWLFAPDTHDRGLRILNVSSGDSHRLARRRALLQGGGDHGPGKPRGVSSSRRRPGPRAVRSRGVAIDVPGEVTRPARHVPVAVWLDSSRSWSALRISAIPAPAHTSTKGESSSAAMSRPPRAFDCSSVSLARGARK